MLLTFDNSIGHPNFNFALTKKTLENKSLCTIASIYEPIEEKNSRSHSLFCIKSFQGFQKYIEWKSTFRRLSFWNAIFACNLITLNSNIFISEYSSIWVYNKALKIIHIFKTNLCKDHVSTKRELVVLCMSENFIRSHGSYCELLEWLTVTTGPVRLCVIIVDFCAKNNLL